MFFRAFLGLFVVLSLAACSDSTIRLPKVFGDEVPPEVANAPRVVPSAKPAGDHADWPLLGNVPSRPKDFTPHPTIDAAKTEMQNDRTEAQQMQQRAR